MTPPNWSDKTLNCPHCGIASPVGVSERERAYQDGFKDGKASLLEPILNTVIDMLRKKQAKINSPWEDVK